MIKQLNKNFGNTPGERIQWLRNNAGMSRREFRDLIKQYYPNCSLSASTVQGWEEGKIPRSNYITMLSNIFNCSEDFILCKTDNYANSTMGNYSQISKDDLFLYDGEPVWVTKITSKGKNLHHYALINSTAGYLVFSDKSTLLIDAISDDTQLFVRNLNIKSSPKEPLSLEMAKNLDKVFIMELNCSVENSAYAGYYTYNPHTKCFEKEDQSIILKETAYNVSYAAYPEL